MIFKCAEIGNILMPGKIWNPRYYFICGKDKNNVWLEIFKTTHEDEKIFLVNFISICSLSIIWLSVKRSAKRRSFKTKWSWTNIFDNLQIIVNTSPLCSHQLTAVWMISILSFCFFVNLYQHGPWFRSIKVTFTFSRLRLFANIYRMTSRLRRVAVVNADGEQLNFKSINISLTFKSKAIKNISGAVSQVIYM